MRGPLKIAVPFRNPFIKYLELPEIAVMFHTYATRVGDHPTREDLMNAERAVEWVEYRLAIWEDPTTPYDAAVKAMCVAALEEYRKVYPAP